MQETSDTCPHCGASLSLPDADEQQDAAVCPECGQSLTEPPAEETDTAAQHAATPKPLELLLALTVVCVFLNMFGGMTYVVISNIVFVAVSILLLSVLGFQDTTGSAPSKAPTRRLGKTKDRLQVFPYELFVVPGWVLLIALRVTDSPYREPVGTGVVIVALLLAAMARRAYRVPAIVREHHKFVSAGDFMKTLISPSYRRKRRHEREQILHRMADELVRSDDAGSQPVAADGSTPAPPSADDFTAQQRTHEKWEAEVDNRYNRWIEEESDRLTKE